MNTRSTISGNEGEKGTQSSTANINSTFATHSKADNLLVQQEREENDRKYAHEITREEVECAEVLLEVAKFELQEALKKSDEEENLRLLKQYEALESKRLEEEKAEREEAARILKEAEKDIASYEKNISPDGEYDDFDYDELYVSEFDMLDLEELSDDEEEKSDETRFKPRQ